jgi:hypothetical protein
MHNTTGNTELNFTLNHSSVTGKTHLYSSPHLQSIPTPPQTFTPIVMINNNNNNNNNCNNNNNINNYQTNLPPRINNSFQLNGVSSIQNPTDFLYSFPPSVPFPYVKTFNLFSNLLVFVTHSTNYC